MHPNLCRASNFFSSRQSGACDGDFVVDFFWIRNLSVVGKQLKLVGTGERDERRGIGDDVHELRRSSVWRSSSRSARL